MLLLLLLLLLLLVFLGIGQRSSRLVHRSTEYLESRVGGVAGPKLIRMHRIVGAPLI